MGAAFYKGAAFLTLQGKLLVALGGSWNTEEPVGYALQEIDFDTQNNAIGSNVLLPDDPSETLADAAIKRLSFYPDHQVGLAISQQGWIYLSVREGRIYCFRPTA
jgi:glucose/arabinose dehydrogenase